MPEVAVKAPLRLSIFAGIDAWPAYVIRERGLLDVELSPTPGSVPQVAGMMAGDFDMALTAMDNIIAYNEGQGEAAVAGPFDFVAVLGVSPGSLNLVVQPGITTYEQLRGQTLAVDAVGTGFSFVLRRMLESRGILPGDYSFVAVGSTQKRFEAIAAGRAAGGLVGSPYERIGSETHGFNVLGSALDTLKSYQGSVAMVRRSWAAGHRSEIVAFIRAYREAQTWLFDPANFAAAADILVRASGLPAGVIARIGPGVLAERALDFASGAFDRAGVETVLELRAAYAAPPMALKPAASYLDSSFQ
jgi:ABC-type nitrate/sulfonate/bicarbonate transport system substrate-binding protein